MIQWVCKLENCHARVWMAYTCHIQIHHTRNNAQKTENITYFLPFISCALLDFVCHWIDKSDSVHCALLLPKMNLIIVFNGCFWSFSTHPGGSITTKILKFIGMCRKVMKKVSNRRERKRTMDKTIFFNTSFTYCYICIYSWTKNIDVYWKVLESTEMYWNVLKCTEIIFSVVIHPSGKSQKKIFCKQC